MAQIKRVILLILPILLIALFSLSAFAFKLSSDKIRLKNIFFEQQDSELSMFFSVKNNLGSEVNNIKVVVSVPESGIRKGSRNFDLEGKDAVSGNIIIEDLEASMEGHYARIVVSNDKVRKVKHILITS